MLKNKLGEDSPIPKFMHLKIQRRDGVESLTTLEEGEFKVSIDGCINIHGDECHSESIFHQRSIILHQNISTFLRTKFTWNINAPFSKNVKSY